MNSKEQEAGMGVGFLERLVNDPKIYNLGDPTVFVPVGRYSSTPGWCFLPWKGIEGEYRWGFKARTEVSDYLSVLSGLQAAFLTDESEAFWVIKNGKRARETQRRARWRDAGAKPNLLKPWGWLEVQFEKLESLGQDHLKGAALDLTATGFEGGEHFTVRPSRARNFQSYFSLATFALWGKRCAITGSALTLEAAHIKPVASCEADDPALTDPYNGIVLTASLHRLLDDGLFGFDPNGNVVVDPRLCKKEREIHQIATSHKVDFKLEAEKYLQYRIVGNIVGSKS
ncbi:HNH endonuclease [Pseudomonas soli]|nr:MULTISPECIES: HNH endonuclease [Pseudomonas]AUY31935.1 HNH endonuclease [Pseudomonas sp. PONIH3]NBK37796.1 HNH endonuclease [Pseudomonas soli]WJO19509.1 HNH endonuclease [Pseudomonas soli]